MTQPARAAPFAKPKIRDVIATDTPSIEIYDIGARSEGEDRYEALITQDLANVSGFEPNPSEFHKLLSDNRPRRRYFPYFLGRGGPATFYLTNWPGCCSLYEPDPAVIDLFVSIDATWRDGNFRVVGTEKVQTTRLDDVPDMVPCDFLKVDVQGAELDVLHGALCALADAVVIECEAEFVPLYKNQPLFGDIQVFLRQHNFVLHKMIDIGGRVFRPTSLGGNLYAPMSQVLWADAVFVREFSRLELYSDEQLIKAAAILYGVYHSYDLALRLILEHDRRRGGSLGIRFKEMMTASKNLPFLYMNLKLNP